VFVGNNSNSIHLQDRHVAPAREEEAAIYRIGYAEATLSRPRLAARHVHERHVQGGGS
jgi:hypothetical protein